MRFFCLFFCDSISAFLTYVLVFGSQIEGISRTLSQNESRVSLRGVPGYKIRSSRGTVRGFCDHGCGGSSDLSMNLASIFASGYIVRTPKKTRHTIRMQNESSPIALREERREAGHCCNPVRWFISTTAYGNRY